MKKKCCNKTITLSALVAVSKSEQRGEFCKLLHEEAKEAGLFVNENN